MLSNASTKCRLFSTDPHPAEKRTRLSQLFGRSAVLVFKNDAEGTLGLILNKRLGKENQVPLRWACAQEWPPRPRLVGSALEPEQAEEVENMGRLPLPLYPCTMELTGPQVYHFYYGAPHPPPFIATQTRSHGNTHSAGTAQHIGVSVTRP